MRMEQAEHSIDAQVDAQLAAIRADALERVLAVLDRIPDGVTVRDLIARIEWEADRETIRLLRGTMA